MAEIVSNPPEGLFESLCSTHIKKCKYEFKWTIKEFSLYRDASGAAIESPTFSNGTDDGLKWRLEIYPFDNSLRLGLYLVSKNVSSLNTKCKFSILNANLEKVKKENRTKQFKTDESLGIRLPISTQELCDNQDEFLPDDGLTILCEIMVAVSSENISRELTIPACHEPNNLGLSLLENPEFSDITLQAGEQQIQAHKAVLAGRSNVFRAMFQHDMKESRTNRVEIQDMDYEILVQMLHFIYTDRFSDIKKATDLVYLSRAADKYELDSLKHQCEKMLVNNLTVQNAVECYNTADQLNAENLKPLIKSFIVANGAYVARTPGFALLVHTHPELVIEALL